MKGQLDGGYFLHSDGVRLKRERAMIIDCTPSLAKLNSGLLFLRIDACSILKCKHRLVRLWPHSSCLHYHSLDF